MKRYPKAMKVIPIQLAYFCLFGFLWSSLCFGADTSEKQKELKALADKEVVAAVSVYMEQGVKPALERIEQGYLLFEKTAGSTWPINDYHHRVWKEAQVLSGRKDEAWALALYTYLFQRRHEKDSMPPGRLMTTDYGLIFNLTESGFNLGKLADMRKWTRKLERSLEVQQGLDLSCKSYPDAGPIFSFLPDARKRSFPTRNKHLGRNTNSNTAERCIYSYVMYSLCAVADSYLYEGDWVRSAELNQWFIDYTHDMIKTPEQVTYPAEVVSFALMRSMKLTEICRLHGHPEEGVKVLDSFLTITNGYKKTGEKDILMAKLERELLYIELGRMSDDACETADKALASTGKNIWNYARWEDFNVELARARVYHQTGRKTEAWEIVNKQLELGKKDVNPRHRIRMLRMAIELALLDGGGHAELESWLKEALTNERKLGDKPAEIWLYERYAEFLVLRGRYPEAEVIQREVVRLAKALNLPDRLASADIALTNIRKKLHTLKLAANTIDRPVRGGTNSLGNDPAGNPLPPITPSLSNLSAQTFADIQPRQSETVISAGTDGFGRFFLLNPSAEDCKGVLEISGPVTNLLQIGNAVVAATVLAGTNCDILAPSVTLAAGAYCIIDLAGAPLGNGDGAKVMLSWLPAGSSESSTSASWSYHAGETVPRAAVIDAHELHQNPFYLLPIYHTLQRPATNMTDTVDVVVKASEPVRIELYDAQTSELVYIDANGDGDFEDEGDLVASDKNGNLHPDLTIPEGRRLHSFLMYVAPLHGQNKTKAINLAVNVLIGDRWTVDSVDKVEFK